MTEGSDVQRQLVGLAVDPRDCATVCRMFDPRLQLTLQELLYAATALGAVARRAERQASEPAYQASRAIFENAARSDDEIASKLTRIAERVRG